MTAALALILALAQQDDYTCRLKKAEARPAGDGWNLTLTFEHTFPDKTQMQARVVWNRYAYRWFEKRLDFGPDDRAQVVGTPFEAQRKTAQFACELKAPGRYDIEIRVDPERQASVSLKGKQVRNFQFDTFVGDPKKLIPALRDDTSDCAKMIRKAGDFMKAIEEGSARDDWEKRKSRIFDEIRRLQQQARDRSDSRQLSATYQVIVCILEDLIKVADHIGYLQKNAANEKEDDPVPTTHGENGGDDPMIADAGQKRLHLTQMKKNLRVADEIRMREFYASIIDFHKRGDHLDELEKTFQHETNELFATITTYTVGDETFHYADLFQRELDRATIDAHLAAARAAAIQR